MDDSAGGTANGTSIQQWTCVNASSNQQWEFIPTSGGYYKVIGKNATGVFGILRVLQLQMARCSICGRMVVVRISNGCRFLWAAVSTNS